MISFRDSCSRTEVLGSDYFINTVRTTVMLIAIPIIIVDNVGFFVILAFLMPSFNLSVVMHFLYHCAALLIQD